MTASVLIVLIAREAGWIGRRLSNILLIGALVTAVFSLSPGLGGLVLAVSFWYSLHTPIPARRRLFAAIGVLGAAAFLFVTLISPPPFGPNWFAEMFFNAQPSGRLMTWQGAWNTFLAHPFLGRGLDLEVCDVHFMSASGPIFNTDAHNTLLSIMAQDGAIGIAAFVLVVFYPLRHFN